MVDNRCVAPHSSIYHRGFLFGFTSFIEPIVNEFGWSYTQISFAASIRGIEIGLLAPVVGLLIDRLGPRKLLFAGGIFYGIGLIVLSRVSSLGQLYGCLIVIATGMSALCGLLPMTVAGYWFRRKVSIATGIVSSGIASGGFLVPMVTRTIDIFGWRTSLIIFGLGALVIIFPLSLIVQHKPEQYGCKIPLV